MPDVLLLLLDAAPVYIYMYGRMMETRRWSVTSVHHLFFQSRARGDGAVEIVETDAY